MKTDVSLLIRAVNNFQLPVVRNFLGYITLEKRREDDVRNLVKKCLSNRCPQFCALF